MKLSQERINRAIAAMASLEKFPDTEDPEEIAIVQAGPLAMLADFIDYVRSENERDKFKAERHGRK